MSATTNVPTITWGLAGPVAPSVEDILAGVQADFDAAFNTSFNWSENTPQGQLATSIAAIVANCYQLVTYYATQVDPAYATGRMQDAIARIYFLERQAAESTVVQALCSGLEGVEIPQFALAKAADGNLYQSMAAGVIADSGNVTLPFACTVPGPTACPAGTLNQIYQAIPGWDSITNIADGVIGTNTETAAAFEERRAASVAKNSSGSLPAIVGELAKVDGVIDYYATQNDTDSPLLLGGYTLAPYSIYVAVIGGDPQEVARAIWTKKAPGCAYNGNTTVVVEDRSGYSPPYPSYDVTFQTPVPLPVTFAVSITNTTFVPADAADQIAAAIVNAASGADGGDRARIGSIVYASRFIAPILALGSWAQVVAVFVGSPNNPDAQFTASIAGTTMTVTAVSSGALAVGQTITASNGSIPAGTRVSAFGTGAGGTGTYTLTKSMTVSSTAMKGAISDSSTVTTQIDQVPDVEADNVVVTLI